MFYKIIHNICPIYLSNLLPPLVSTVNPYHRRRPMERLVPAHHTDIYNKSFFPSTSTLWNSLPLFIQQTQSIGQLKHYLFSADTPVPRHYYLGNRKEQIIHCRLRLGMSDLKHDMYNRHIVNDPSCTCSFPQETAEHFLLHCPIYTTQRTDTIFTLPQEQISTRNLLYGIASLSFQSNALIFETVHKYIMLTTRFDS